jgi:hypothetical protein
VLALEFFSSAELTLGSFPMIRRHNAIRFAFEKKRFLAVASLGIIAAIAPTAFQRREVDQLVIKRVTASGNESLK